jgi:hypothetical protein
MSVTADIAVIVPAVLSSAVIGAVITAVSGTAAIRRADRRAEHDQARELLSQVMNGMAQLETEVSYRELRNSIWASVHTIEELVIEIAAAYQDGNWLRGVANAVRAKNARDAAEADRYAERRQAAALRITPALVSLSLFSPQLQEAASQMNNALTAAARACEKDKRAANTELSAAIAGLRTAVYEFTTPQRRFPRRPALKAAPKTGYLVPPRVNEGTRRVPAAHRRLARR